MIEKLQGVQDIKVEKEKDLTSFSTLRLTARGDLVTVFSKEALKKVLNLFQEQNVEPIILGWGANILLKETSSRPYLKIEIPNHPAALKEYSSYYELSASTPLNQLTSHAIRFGIKGWESFTGVPATLGGAVFMNAGTALGEIGQIVKKVYIMTPEGDERVHEVDQESFVYRANCFLKNGEVIYKVGLKTLGQSAQVAQKIKEYIDYRKSTQPMGARTCGCVFKNKAYKDGTICDSGCRAGHIIDILGLKGIRHKNLRVSPVHGNFVENLGESTYSDFLEFIQWIREEVKLQTGLEFEFEVRI